MSVHLDMVYTVTRAAYNYKRESANKIESIQQNHFLVSCRATLQQKLHKQKPINCKHRAKGPQFLWRY